MGVVTGSAGLRRGLVALLLLVAVLPGSAQPGAAAGTGTAVPGVEVLALKSAEEVLAARSTRLHEQALNLLFLMPGALFVLFAVTFRRRSALLVFLGAVLLAVPVEPSGDEAGTLVREAQEAFEAGRIEEAVDLYTRAATLLPGNPALEHNLGICQAASGRIGEAVVHLRRSLRTRPADPLTRRALQAVQDHAGLEAQLPLPVPLDPEVPFAAVLVLANLSLGAAGFAVRRKRVRTVILVILLSIATVIALGFFLGLLYNENRPAGVVVGQDVGLLRIPEHDARASFVLPPGTSLRIRGRAGDYFLVETAFRLRGWVPSEAMLLD